MKIGHILKHFWNGGVGGRRGGHHAADEDDVNDILDKYSKPRPCCALPGERKEAKPY